MSEVSSGIFVGGSKDAASFRGQRICVLDERPDAEDVPLDAHRTIYDERTDSTIRKNLDEVADLVARAHDRGEPVLLFCGHGVRRSPLAAAWYLHRAERIPLDAAYERIRAARPQVEHVRDWVGHWENLDDPPPSGSRPRPSR